MGSDRRIDRMLRILRVRLDQVQGRLRQTLLMASRLLARLELEVESAERRLSV